MAPLPGTRLCATTGKDCKEGLEKLDVFGSGLLQRVCGALNTCSRAPLHGPLRPFPNAQPPSEDSISHYYCVDFLQIKKVRRID